MTSVNLSKADKRQPYTLGLLTRKKKKKEKRIQVNFVKILKTVSPSPTRFSDIFFIMTGRRRCLLNCPKVKGIKLYSFPKDEIRHQVWLRLLDMEHICILRPHLCARHFSSYMLYKTRLVDDAVPDINLEYIERPNPSLEDENESAFECLSFEEEDNCTKHDSTQVKEIQSVTISPQSQGSVSQAVKMLKLPKYIKILPKPPSDPLFVPISKLQTDNTPNGKMGVKTSGPVVQSQNPVEITKVKRIIKQRSKEQKTRKTRTPLAPLEMRMATRIWQSKEWETETPQKLPTLPTRGKPQTTQPTVQPIKIAAQTSVTITKTTIDMTKEKPIVSPTKLVRVKNIHDVESTWKEQAKKVAELTENAKTLLVKSRNAIANNDGMFYTTDSNDFIIEEHTESEYDQSVSFSNIFPISKSPVVHEMRSELVKTGVRAPRDDRSMSDLLCDEVLPNEEDLVKPPRAHDHSYVDSNNISDVEFISLEGESFDCATIRKLVSESTQTGTNGNHACGLIEKSPIDGSFNMSCFFCTTKYPLCNWQQFIDHVKTAHQFEMNPKSQSIGRIENLTIKAKNRQSVEANARYTFDDLDRLLPHPNIQYALVQGSEPKTFALMPLQKLLNGKGFSHQADESIRNHFDNNNCAESDDADEKDSISSLDISEFRYNSKVIHLKKTEPARVMKFLEILCEHPLLWHTRRHGPIVYDKEMEVFITKFDKTMTSMNFRNSMDNLRDCHRRYMPPPADAEANSSKIKLKSDLQRRIYFDKLCEIEELSRDFALHCDLCSYYFLDRERLETHKYLKHNIGNLKYPCSCGLRFPNVNKKDEHELQHKPKPTFICELCGMSFLFNRTLSNHMNTKHADVIENPLPYKCTICDASFPNSQARSWHTLKHAPPRFNCTICGQSYLKSFPFKQHMKKHLDQRDHICEDCGKAFVEKRNLIKHRYRLHNAGGYHCEQCDTYYKCYEKLFIHNQLKHPNGTNTERPYKKQRITQSQIDRKPRSCCSLKPRTFKCKQCGMQFERQYQLMRHKRVLNHHLGERYYKCGVCTVVLKSRVALVRHLRCLHDQSVSFAEVKEKEYSLPTTTTTTTTTTSDNCNVEESIDLNDETEFAVQTINCTEEEVVDEVDEQEENIIVEDEDEEITEIFEEFHGDFCIEEEVTNNHVS